MVLVKLHFAIYFHVLVKHNEQFFNRMSNKKSMIAYESYKKTVLLEIPTAKIALS